MEGKMTSGKKGPQHNAIKHGIFAGILLSGSGFPEVEVFEQLLSGAREAVRPRNQLEEFLTQKIALLFLRLMRVYEADLEIAPRLFARVKETLDTKSAGFDLNFDDKVVNKGVTIDTILRYETGIERQIARTLSQIQQLRRMREIDLEPIPQEAQTSETQTSIVSQDPALLP
jgi:hypothetical protein